MKDEEMIKDIKEVQPFFYGNIAEMFIEKGYRKESDTAREILQDLFYFIDGNNFWLEETGNQVYLIKEKDALNYMRAQASKYEVEVEE